MEKLYTLSAVELIEKLKNKEIQVIDVVNSVYDRIDEVEEKVSSFISIVSREKALELAKLSQEKYNNGNFGKLEGIPVVIKDNMVSEGEKATAASKILGNYEGIYDAFVVKKLKEAGAIIIAKANMDEFAMGSTTKTSYVKETKNPWDLDRTPGGSSGGSASSVAAGEGIISLGSDTGGSIRQPASFNGLVGLKPTYGRVSRYGLIAFASSLDQIGPMGKSVEDVALMLSVIEGYDEMDTTSYEIESSNYFEEMSKDIKGLKIGIPKEYFEYELKPEFKKVFDESIEKFKELGAEIVDITLPHTEYAAPTYYIIAPAEASSNLARFDGVRYGYRASEFSGVEDLYIKSRSEGFGDEVKRRIMIGTYVLSAGFYDAYYKQAQKVRRLIKNDFDKAFSEVDVILAPATTGTAFRLDEPKTPVELYLEDVFTIPANMAGIPGLVVPAGKVEGLPVGIQLLGKAFDEKTLFRVGKAFENVVGKMDMAKL
ncbi:MAG: Asp-tRNA(Asn)/Glu-tRNA(Gln) amidotransferase subunit GatA [Fusobacteriaceae bacterium]|nr:Asp-tRNA(Asn)/Glu-tRNA(Gln) amidotransferase subunit GatA [Fusobacteriaceae bacterium]MBN2837979.1 Asp-tRNA(Asn)/Glu-tRNA(Gln) amidotransferase subunit GatA [Fusobacteriaceae bacterium]